MDTKRIGGRSWLLLVVLLSLPLLGAQCPDEDADGQNGSNNGLGEGEGDDGDGVEGDPADDDVDFHVCVESDCGPQLGMPNWECPDGSLAGPTGACVPTANGECGWEVAYCSEDPGDGGDPGECDPATGMVCCDPSADPSCCDPATGANCDPNGGGGGGEPGCDSTDASCGCECEGPAPGMPNWICEDGSIGGPSCEPGADGTCGWLIRDCPPNDGGGGGDACNDCPDPAPGMPNWECADGTVGGPVCEYNADGTCGWVIRDCPEDDGGSGECSECPGPAPGMPNTVCPDGSIGGPFCQPDETGVCGWVIVECPEDPSDCRGAGEACDDCPGPAPGMPNWLCENGCVGGPACLYEADGSCSWHILDCE